MLGWFGRVAVGTIAGLAVGALLMPVLGPAGPALGAKIGACCGGGGDGGSA